MPSPPTFEEAWRELGPGFRGAMGQAWASLVRRGLPVGATVSAGPGVVSSGRNRAYDPPGGPDPLQRTPIAHAEMNALASAPEGLDWATARLWSTHEPCSMCAAAADFVGVGEVQFLATDPSSEEPGGYVSSGVTERVWSLAANLLFLHNVAWVAGRDSTMLERNRDHEPGLVDLVLELESGRALIDDAEAGAGVEVALAGVWDRIVALDRERSRRG